MILHQEPHAKKLYQKQQCNCVVPKSDDGYSADSIATSTVVPKSDDGFNTKKLRDQDLACPVLDIGMINVPNEYTPPYIDLLIDPLKKEENFLCNKDLLQQSLELQTEVIGGYQQPDQVPLDKQDFSMGQEFRGASPINL